MAAKEQPIFHLMTNKQTIACLSFVGGFVDAAGYVMLYNLYTSAMTGNIVAAVLPIYEDEPGVYPRVLVWLGMGFGSGILAMYSMKLRYATSMDKWEIGLRLFGCELLALCITTIVGSLLTFPRLISWQVMLQAVLMSICMGIQNAAAFITIPNCAMTTAMSGNTIRFFLYGAEALTFWLASRRRILLYPEGVAPANYDEQMQTNSRQMARRFRVFLAALGPFTVGAIVGVPLTHNFSLLSLLVPTLVVGWIVGNIWCGLRAQQERLAARKSVDGKGAAVELAVCSPIAGIRAQDAAGKAKSVVESAERAQAYDSDDESGMEPALSLFEDANYEVQATIAEQREQQVPQARQPVVFRSAQQEV